MKTSGISGWLPPTRLHAFVCGMGFMAGVFVAAWIVFGSVGCAHEKQPHDGLRGKDGGATVAYDEKTGTTTTYRKNGVVEVRSGVQCAPGPEVVK